MCLVIKCKSEDKGICEVCKSKMELVDRYTINLCHNCNSIVNIHDRKVVIGEEVIELQSIMYSKVCRNCGNRELENQYWNRETIMKG